MNDIDTLERDLKDTDSKIAELTARRTRIAKDIDTLAAASASAGPYTYERRKKATIIGGRGKMGQWMLRYLEKMDIDAGIVDISEGNIEDSADSDIVVISVPIPAVGSVLNRLDGICGKNTLIFDISSIKSPFRADLRRMAEHKKVCSVHPMFGPSVTSVSERSVIVCGCGCEEAVRETEGLFAAANVITMDLERHDALMAYVLAFAHASGIVFFTALRESGIPFGELERASSTTFGRCLEACIPVSLEDPDLYHGIQRLNENSEEMWNVFESAFGKVKDASLSDDPKMFAELMECGREYLRKS